MGTPPDVFFTLMELFSAALSSLSETVKEKKYVASILLFISAASAR